MTGPDAKAPAARDGVWGRVLVLSLIWLGVAAGVLGLAAYLLFQKCAFDGCSLEWAILFWIGVFTLPFALLGLGIHLAAAVFLPRARGRRAGD